jgi:hypothetical protein
MIPAENTLKRNQIVEAHRQLITEMREIEKQIEEKLLNDDPAWSKLEVKRNELYHQIEPLVEQYWMILPEMVLSSCPFCRRELKRKFDSVDLSGFWWMERTQRDVKESSCEHFVLLVGAVNFNGLTPKGGIFSGFPGPDAPYVIPQVLKMKEMIVVVSEIKMGCGYSVYPIGYFSKHPPQQKPHIQPWAQQEYFLTLDGTSAVDVYHIDFDYELLPWLRKKKIRWVIDGKLNVESENPQSCPFLNADGKRKKMRLLAEQLVYRE